MERFGYTPETAAAELGSSRPTALRSPVKEQWKNPGAPTVHLSHLQQTVNPPRTDGCDPQRPGVLLCGPRSRPVRWWRSRVLIPYLKQALGFPVDQAALLSLITIGTNTGIQTIQDRKAIAWTPVLLFSVVSFPVATLSGQFLAPITSDTLRMILFGLFTLSVALMMLLRKNRESEEQGVNLPGLGFAAITTGIICGLVGVGGGIFITQP